MNRYGDDFFDFIAENLNTDIVDLSLRLRGQNLSFATRDALIQINARRKSSRKIPWFIQHPRFIFPDESIAEQATNQYVARYHASLIEKGMHVADMTAGLGIDAITLALCGNYVTAYELNPDRADAILHNAGVAGAENITVVTGDSVDDVRNSCRHYDWIFIDPARRDAANVRSFRLSDSLPDVTAIEDMLVAQADNVMVKASPLLDITQTIRDMHHVSAIHIVSCNGECKEMLLILSDTTTDNPFIEVVDIDSNETVFPEGDPQFRSHFSCHLHDLTGQEIAYAATKDILKDSYIYEVSAGMRKLDCAGILCHRFPILKSFAKESGIFISEELYNEFPGRISRITALPSAADMKRLSKERLRVVSKAFPETAERLRRRLNLREGDMRTLIVSTLNDDSHVKIIAEKVSSLLEY